jgi:hypothetical protein
VILPSETYGFVEFSDWTVCLIWHSVLFDCSFVNCSVVEEYIVMHILLMSEWQRSV